MSSVSCSTRFVTAHLAQRGPQVAPRLNLTRYSKNKLRRSRRGPSRPVTCSFWETKNVSTRPGPARDIGDSELLLRKIDHRALFRGSHFPAVIRVVASCWSGSEPQGAMRRLSLQEREISHENLTSECWFCAVVGVGNGTKRQRSGGP